MHRLVSLRRRHGVVLGLLSLAISCTPGSAPDGGTSDAAADVSDGGGDGGADACADLDPVLGTLTLAGGFTVVESVPLSPAIAALRVVDEGASQRVYGLDLEQGAVTDLGAWPLEGRTPAKVFTVMPADLDDEGATLSWFLAHDGTRFAAGYTGSFDTETFVAPGALAIFDPTAGVAEPLTFVNAANNFAADFVGDTLVLHASSLGALEEGTAIYAASEEPRVLATYPDPTQTYGGPVIAIGDSVVLAGFDAAVGRQRFFLLDDDDVAGALSGEPVPLADAEEVLSAPSLTASRFGADLAYVHGDFFNPFEAVRVVRLSAGSDRTPLDVLRFQDSCTSVDLLAALGDDLLVAVDDDAGERRLLRIREDG